MLRLEIASHTLVKGEKCLKFLYRFYLLCVDITLAQENQRIKKYNRHLNKKPAQALYRILVIHHFAVVRLN